MDEEMIETQQLLPSSPKHTNSRRKVTTNNDMPSSYGALQNQNNQEESFLKGEDLLLHDPDSGIVSPPQSVEQGGQYDVPLSGNLQNGISPLSNGGLPPAIPLRRRADSSGDRSLGELSTVSGVSGNMRVQRAASYDGDLSPPNNNVNYNGTPGSGYNNNYAIPPKPLSRRHSRRRSHSASPVSTPGSNNAFNMQFVGHPLHKNDSNDHHRRSSDGYYMRSYSSSSINSGGSNRHRRTHSYDAMPQKHLQQQQTRLRRGDSSASLYSVNSQGSMNSETLKLLPDPRWGGGSGGSRARSFSGGSGTNNQNQMGIQSSMSYSSGGGMYSENRNGSYSTEKTTAGIMGSYSNDSQEHEKFLYNGYGSINPAATTTKDVIGAGSSMTSGEMQPLRGNHRRTNSEVSASTYASQVSIDQSVEPVMTNMSKSAMFKGVTNDGVVKLQLPKDNFRLLSDRDLEAGTVYKRALVDNEDDYFQDYHITVEDHGDSIFPPVSSECQCTCSNCENCHVRRKQLPPTYYVMSVDADIYRRMFDEVSASMNMPCGLFYCGHHEDVDYPSIKIALAGVTFVFAVMLWATLLEGG